MTSVCVQVDAVLLTKLRSVFPVCIMKSKGFDAQLHPNEQSPALEKKKKSKHNMTPKDNPQETWVV